MSRSNPRSNQFLIRIHPSVAKRIREIAASEFNNVSAVTRRLISVGLAHEPVPRKTANNQA